MDISPPLLNYMTQNYWSCPSSDSEFYTISSPEAVSPISRSSPPHSQHPGGGKATASLREEGGRSRVGTRRMRSKNPSKQRQSASEKEKLRMRDLTKALHHLRTYLPPTVAPVGQTLTKIETLRLTIRYISYLSAQLGLGEESLYQMKDMRTSRDQESPQNQTEGICCYNSPTSYWGFRDELPIHQELHQSTFRPEHVSRKTETNLNQVCMNVETQTYDNSLNSSLESLLEYPSYANTALTYQVCILTVIMNANNLTKM